MPKRGLEPPLPLREPGSKTHVSTSENPLFFRYFAGKRLRHRRKASSHNRMRIVPRQAPKMPLPEIRTHQGGEGSRHPKAVRHRPASADVLPLLAAPDGELNGLFRLPVLGAALPLKTTNSDARQKAKPPSSISMGFHLWIYSVAFRNAS